MELSNEIVLRPRFSLEAKEEPEQLLTSFKDIGKDTKDFVVSRVDDHVFIRFPKHKQTFWTPQLHLEIYKIESQPTIIKGLYGPNPTVWTLFMFLHFLVATLFIGAIMWMYANISLNASYVLPLITMITLFILWFVLYFLGRLGKRKGKSEMLLLRNFFYHTLKRKPEPGV